MPFDPVGYVAPVETKPLDEVALICHRAAEILERDGWCQGRALSATDNSHCMMGAVWLALGYELPRMTWMGTFKLGMGNSDESVDISPMATIAARLGFGDGWSAASWNDTPHRTAAEAIARLRSVR